MNARGRRPTCYKTDKMGATNSLSLCGAKEKRSDPEPNGSSDYEDITYITVATDIQHTREYSAGVLLAGFGLALIAAGALLLVASGRS